MDGQVTLREAISVSHESTENNFKPLDINGGFPIEWV